MASNRTLLDLLHRAKRDPLLVRGEARDLRLLRFKLYNLRRGHPSLCWLRLSFRPSGLLITNQIGEITRGLEAVAQEIKLEDIR